MKNWDALLSEAILLYNKSFYLEWKNWDALLSEVILLSFEVKKIWRFLELEFVFGKPFVLDIG